MLHGKFRGYGRGGHLSHVTQMPQTFVPPTKGGSTYNLALKCQAVLEKKMFEKVDGRRRRTPDHCK